MKLIIILTEVCKLYFDEHDYDLNVCHNNHDNFEGDDEKIMYLMMKTDD